MKKIKYLLLAIFLFLLIPKSVFAAELKQTFYTEKSNVVAEHQLIMPSYDNEGNLDGHLICYLSETKTCSKYDLSNEFIWATDDLYDYNIETETIYSNDDFYDLIVNGETDVIIIKYKDESDEVEWLSQFGGNNNEQLLDIIKSYNAQNEHDGYLSIIMSNSTNIPNITPGYILVKYDLEGNKLWNKNINNISSILIEEDKDIALFNSSTIGIGSAEDYIEKPIELYGNKMIQSKNKYNELDGYIVAGTTNEYMYMPNDMFNLIGHELIPNNYNHQNVIIKIDSSGDVIWSKEYTKYENVVLYDVVLSKTPSGEVDGYLAVGMASKSIEKRVTDDFLDSSYIEKTVGLFLKYDLDGNLVFEEEIGSKPTALTSITENYDENGNFNGYVIVGHLYNEDIQPQNATKKITPQTLLNRNEQNKVKEVTANDVPKFTQLIVKYTYQNYEIEKNIETGGSVVVYKDAYPGTIVPINVKAEEGYILEKIIIQDKDGTEISIENNSFLMPEGKVTVIAKFKKLTNPETSALGYTLVFIILLVAIATFTVRNQKIKEEPEIETL